MSERPSHREIALFPLGTVVFPHTTLPLRIFEPRYVDLIGRCMREAEGFGVVAIREGRETGGAAVPHATGTFARIVDFDQGADGLLNIVIRGEQRFRVESTAVMPNNLLTAEVTLLENLPLQPVPEDCAGLATLLAEIRKNAPADPWSLENGERFAATLGYALAQYLPLDLVTKVGLLELEDDLALMQRLDEEVRRLRANVTD